MLNERDVETLRVRLELQDQLLVMLVALRYTDRHREKPTLDVWRMASRDVRAWFDTLADMPGFEPALLERESLRLLRAVEVRVEQIAGPRPPDPD